jgi:hypothetical protein
MRPSPLTTTATALLLLALAPALPAASLDDLGWLAGHWRSEERGAVTGSNGTGGTVTGGTVTEELWTTPAGGLMLGLNRQIRPGRRAAFEFLRIEESAEGIRYVASPGGGPATAFPLARTAERRVVFENPEHDWPQVIEYRLDEAGVLHLRAAGLEAGSQELTWTMVRTDEH